MASTKKERIMKRHNSRNRRKIRKIMRIVANKTHTVSYLQMAKRGDFSFTSPSSARNIMFNHRPEAHIETVMRFPNKKEKYEEIMCVLRSMYYFGNFSMKRNAYYTLKGMARKNPENPCVINFIKKHDCGIMYDGLIEYFNSEHLYGVHKFSVGCYSCTTMYSININGGGDGNENKETENSGKEKEDSDKRIEKA